MVTHLSFFNLSSSNNSSIFDVHYREDIMLHMISVKKCLFTASLLVCSFAYAKSDNGTPDDKHAPSLLSDYSNAPVIKRLSDSIYSLIGLNNYGLQKDVFFSAYKGYQYLLSKGMLKKANLLTICDYSQSSKNKRLYVIDVVGSRLLYNTFVSHGRNSGNEYASSFSNLESSNKSSLGFLLTADTYVGKAGYSMRFNGLEPGINDQVRNRDIVLHGSRFVNEVLVNIKGSLSKSLGCPAVPLEYHKKIIDAIKGGSCYFAYYPDDLYLHTSRVLNSSFDLAPAALNNMAATTANSPADGVTSLAN